MIRAKNTKTFGAAPKAPQFHKRRKPTEGEDIKALKNVMREIEGQNIALQDFILLVAPHTGDKGATLTKVMGDDLNNFRRFCNEAYETMTKDTNEVMATTQVELGQLYAERARLLTVNIINCMKTIHDFIPDFNLEEYNAEPDKYLSTKFNILDLPDEREIDLAKRQLAYHRLNWLQSEGDRLAAENNKLQQRLNELKKIQKKEISEQVMKEREADAQRIALEKQQAEMQIQLEHLVEELLQTIVREEKKIVDERKNTAKNSLLKKKPTGDPKKLTLKRKDTKWSAKAARDIEMNKMNATTASVTATTTTTVPSSSTIKSAPPISPKRQLRPKTATRKYAQSTPAPCATATPTPAICSSPPASRLKQKAAPTTRKKKAKKPVPITQRPAWQDVDINVEDVMAAPMEQAPIDIFAIGRPGSTYPSTTCTSTTEPSASRGRSPPPRQYAAPTQSRQSPAQPRPAPRQPSPPRCVGRRAAGPRDTWGGFF